MIILPLFWHDTMFIQVIFLFTEILNDVQKKRCYYAYRIRNNAVIYFMNYVYFYFI